MRVLKDPVEFDWDNGNIQKNWERHRVSQKEAEEVFQNEHNIIYPDEKHSVKEKRYTIFGVTKELRKLSIVFTLRQSKIRIIMARDMSKKERRGYEAEIKKNTKI